MRIALTLARAIEMQKYSRGRRGAPAKGVGWATGARVQIPPSAYQKISLKKVKKDVDIREMKW